MPAYPVPCPSAPGAPSSAPRCAARSPRPSPSSPPSPSPPLIGAAGAARERWGRTRPVAVATRDLGPGDVVDAGAVEVRELPARRARRGDLAEAPVGAVVRHPILAGEPVAPARLAPDGLTGVAALVPAGERAVAVPVGPAGAPPLAVGDLVDVLAVVPGDAGRPARRRAGDGPSPAFPLVERAAVVDVAERPSRWRSPSATPPGWRGRVANGAVVLALAGA